MMISQNTKNWLIGSAIIFVIWFLADRYKNRVTKEDQKNNLEQFFNKIIAFDQQQKINQIEFLKHKRRINFAQQQHKSLTPDLLINPIVNR